MRKKTMITASILALVLSTATACGGKQLSENQNAALPSENETETASDDNSPNVLPATVNEDTTTIGGIVRSVAQDSFVISRTLMDDPGDGGFYVTIPEESSPEEELVTIRCSDTTTFELWTIQGGGAGITTDEAAFSDIHKGTGLEAEGYFDGEDFIAGRVIIEIYE